ncbi:Casein kinase I isoform delta, partial [Perkinsus olseni]
CGGTGHFGRACPCPEPSRKRPRTTADPPKTAEVNAVHLDVDSKNSRLQLLEVTIGNCDDTSSCSARGLLDSGCEVALVSADELDRWQRAGVSVPLLPDETTLIPFDGAQRHKVLGRGQVKLTLEDSTSIDLMIRVAPQLSYPLILPLHVLRLAGGAVWVIADDDTGNGDSIFLRPDVRGLLRQMVDPGTDLKKLGLGTYTTDSIDRPLGVNSVGAHCSSGRDEDLLEDYVDVPRHADQLLPVALVPDRSAPDGRPSVSVPWRSSDRPKPNYAQAKARDASVLRRLDPQKHQQYKTCVDSLIDDDIAVPIDGPSDKASYFIPAVPIFRPSSTTP